MVGAAPGGAAGDGAGPASWQNDLTPIGAGDWDHQKAARLLERAGFGATPAEVERLAGRTPTAAVDWLVDYQQHADTPEPFDPSPISDPAMLVHLDHGENVKDHLNENFGRECSAAVWATTPSRAFTKGRARSPAGPTTSWSSRSSATQVAQQPPSPSRRLEQSRYAFPTSLLLCSALPNSNADTVRRCGISHTIRTSSLPIPPQPRRPYGSSTQHTPPRHPTPANLLHSPDSPTLGPPLPLSHAILSHASVAATSPRTPPIHPTPC